MIRLTNVRIEGFRLLEDVEIAVEELTTVVVGRNNSGKTSLAEVFDRFLGEKEGKFRLEDFSSAVRERFVDAKKLRDIQNTPPEDILKELPVISLTLTFTYDLDTDNLGVLGPFIIDLDDTCNTAIVRIEYSPDLKTVSKLLDVKNEELFRHLRDAIPKYYSTRYCAIDPISKDNNKRTFERTAELRSLIRMGFIKAQRTLDLGKRGDTDVIGKLLTTLFKTADTLTASVDDQKITQQLKASVVSLEQEIKKDFDGHLADLLPALNIFGFPSLNDTELRPQTTIDVESLLTDNTRIFYNGTDGIHLPEGYNGLGTRNLIYILIQLEALHKVYRASEVRPVTHLVFIEEPEAHLHPQMQEVFIDQLNAAVVSLSEKYPDEPVWPVQFIVSTHSSHLANAAQFDAIRYFLNEQTKQDGVRHTKVKDFRRGAETISSEDRKFLHRYMTLTNCDLYFADKAILVEGATERILMPRFIKSVDKDLSSSRRRLSQQYITTIEVGGAYAHRFYPLLNFLELKALIITDIDPLSSKETEEKRKKCLCAEGERTSNPTIKEWFGKKEITIKDILSKEKAEKEKYFCRIAYQIPEEGSQHCATSYEDAFILANLKDHGIDDNDEAAENARNIVKNLKKTDDAIKWAISEEDWNVPQYIKEGLVWLSESSSPSLDALGDYSKEPAE